MNISSRQSSDLTRILQTSLNQNFNIKTLKRPSARTIYNQVGKGICVTATPLAEPAVELVLHIDDTKYKKYLFNVGET